MDTAMFIMGVFGIMGLLMALGMSSQNSAKRNGERNTKGIVMIVGLIFCILWLITGVAIILMEH